MVIGTKILVNMGLPKRSVLEIIANVLLQATTDFLVVNCILPRIYWDELDTSLQSCRLYWTLSFFNQERWSMCSFTRHLTRRYCWRYGPTCFLQDNNLNPSLLRAVQQTKIQIKLRFFKRPKAVRKIYKLQINPDGRH